jgi:hypothetical protein
MTARFSASVAFSLALAAVSTGCTVHTYSGAAYPGTAYTRSEPTRYEVSYRANDGERESDRGYVVPQHRPAKARAQAPTNRQDDRAEIEVRDRDRWTARDRQTNGSWSRVSTTQTKPERAKPSMVKPSTAKPTPTAKPAPKNKASNKDGAVTLTPTQQKDKYGRLRSFDERLGEVFEQKKEQLAREERERQARSERAVGAATDKNL